MCFFSFLFFPGKRDQLSHFALSFPPSLQQRRRQKHPLWCRHRQPIAGRSSSSVVFSQTCPVKKIPLPALSSSPDRYLNVRRSRVGISVFYLSSFPCLGSKIGLEEEEEEEESLRAITKPVLIVSPRPSAAAGKL